MKRNKGPKRGEGRKTFSIVIDGETEQWYLEKLRQHENPQGITIKPDLPQKKSLEDQYQIVLDNAKKYNTSIWIVDLDVVLQENKIQTLNRYIEDNRNNNRIHILINTPCLEFWFLQHVSDSGRYFATGAQVINEMKKFQPLTAYEKTAKYFVTSNPNIYIRLQPSLKNALANAARRGSYEPNEPAKGKAEIYKLFSILGLDK